MPFRIAYTKRARLEFETLDARWQATLRDAFEIHLRHQPRHESSSRIKKLREIDHPQYRLRVDTMRVFYDIEEDIVVILGIVPKDATIQWLQGYQHPI